MRWRERHPWNFDLKNASSLQKELALSLDVNRSLGPCRYIAAVDSSNNRGARRLFAGAIAFDATTGTVIEQVSACLDVAIPYVPGFLSFRELPPILHALSKLQTPCQAVLCDGQGIAHPRGLGLASHLGLWLELPTVGCAKSPLWGHFREPSQKPGEHSPIYSPENGEIIGAVLRTRKEVKPLFVSPGHLCDVPSARSLVLSLVGKTRLPTPSHLVHHFVNGVRRQAQVI